MERTVKTSPLNSHTQEGGKGGKGWEAKKQDQRRAMKALASAIRDAVGPADQDEGTFIRCSECQRWVCPGCVGVCPVEMCGERVCVGCKGGDDGWGSCAWHEMVDEEEGKGNFGEEGRGEGEVAMDIETPFFRKGSNERKLIFPGTESRFVPGEWGGEGEWVEVRCREKSLTPERDSEGHLRSCGDDTVCDCLMSLERRNEEAER